MRHAAGNTRHGERGVTVIELLVAVAIFALFIVMIDAVFFGANRSAKKAELAADVQQNARIAGERLTREIRESRSSDTPAAVRVGGSAGEMAVVFKSARLPANNAVMCLFARSLTDGVYNNDCFTFAGLPGGTIPIPPYPAADPFPTPVCSPTALTPCGTYTLIWQQYVGYYVVDLGGGVKELRRVAVQLDTPAATLPDPADTAWKTGGTAIATHLESFDVALDPVAGTFAVTLRAAGTEIVQGSQIPAQQMHLPGMVLFRN